MFLIFPRRSPLLFFGDKAVVKLWPHRALVTTALAIVLVAVPASALDPDRRISQYAHSAWRMQDGPFGSAPNTITQTTDGYVWIGTMSGISRFDGVRFVSWNPPGGEVIGRARIIVLQGTTDGSLWIGTDRNGVWQWKDHTLTSYLSSETLIASILEDNRGSIWITRANVLDGSGPVCEIRSGQAHCYNIVKQVGPTCCFVIKKDSAGSIWLGSGEGFTVWTPEGSAFKTYKVGGSHPHSGGVYSILVAPDTTAWIGVSDPGRGKGLQHFAHGKLGPVRIGGWDSSKEGVYALLLDRHGALWVGTSANGVFRIYNSNVDHFSASDGLSGDLVSHLLEDREGNIWVSTSRGVDCFRDLAVSTFSTREGIGTNEVDSVLATRGGSVWIGGDGVLDNFSKGNIRVYGSGKGLPGQQVTSLMEDHNARLWVGIDETISILENGKFTEIKRPNGKPMGFVVGITEDAEDNVWLEISGNPRELVQIRNYHVKRVFSAPEVPDGQKVGADPHGGIWLGLLNGDLARYREGKLDTFHFPRKKDSMVNQVSAEPDGSVFGATDFGLIGWRQGKQQILTRENGLPCDAINSFVRDRAGAIWLYTQCGLVRIPHEEFEGWWRNPSARVRIRFFDSTDGVQPGYSPFQGAALARDGKLWFANQGGLQMIDPEHLPSNSFLPPVHVEEITAAGRTLSAANDRHLPAFTRSVSIRYTALSFVAPQRVRFKYMLEGQDNVWQDAGTRREAFYTNLRPGDYRFRVIACNNDGVWNETGDSIDFSIAAAYYQTKWFVALCALTLAVVLWLFYLMRLKHAQEQVEQRLGERLDERERISRELHDTLLQGFQGLMLRFQAVMKMLPPQEAAHQMMEKVMDHADEVLLEGRRSVQGLREAGAAGGDLAETLHRCGQELAEGGATLFALSVLGTPVPINPIVREEIFRIAREALLNAFQHAKAVKVEVELTYSRRTICLRIRDDGAGIEPSILSAGRPGHWGLSGMRERAQKIGAKLNIWSRHGAGTEIDLTIQVKAASSIKRKRPFWRRLRPYREH